MNEFIGNHISFIVNWGQLVALSLVAVALLLIYRIGRGNRLFLPKGALAWLGCLILAPLMVLSALVFARITVIKPGVLEILGRLEEIKGEVAPALGYQLVESGEKERIEDLRGKVVLVNFWATWCMPCRSEMPELDRLQREHSADLVVLTISDETRNELRDYQAQFQYSMRSGYLEKFPWVDMGSERPVTFLVDRSGTVRDYFTGPWDFDHFAAAIKPYL